ncbi:hypothetical protein ON010_g15727 [Phytophthora cinnamomi]|nr:hypothetical protein ON010_g15727 [Phytophthora cinnamomi]
MRVLHLDQERVQASANNASHQRTADRDPEVVVVRRPHLGAVAHHVRQQPRPEVARRIHSVPRVHTKTHAERHDHERKRKWRADRPRRPVVLVRDGVDAQQQHARGQRFRVEGGDVADVGARVRGKV